MGRGRELVDEAQGLFEAGEEAALRVIEGEDEEPFPFAE